MNRMFTALFVFTLISSGVRASEADQKNAAPPTPIGATRVATVNLHVVLSKYDKAKDFKIEIERSMKQLQAEAKQLTQDLTAWQGALQKNEFKDGTKEQYEEKIINARRRLEDLSRMASLSVGKTQQAHLAGIWNEMQQAVRVFAARHQIQLVIAYGEPPTADNASAAYPNIERKLRAADQGSGVPIFMTPGVEISDAVADLMNKKYQAEKTRAPRKTPLDLK